MNRPRRLPRDPGPAGWNSLLPEPEPVQRLEEDLSVDWLIVGAGFAGLSAARRLSQLCPKDRIVVVDATRVGEGPAGRNSGFMIDLPHDLSSANYSGGAGNDLAEIVDNRLALAFAKETAEAFGLPREALRNTGKINGAASNKGLKHNLDYKAHLDEIGEENTLLDANEMSELTGTSYYQSGLYTPGTMMLQPAMYVRGVAQGLRSNRVQIFENSPVLAFERKAYWVAKTPKGTIRAPKVILAVNGHLQSFGYMAGRLVHTHTYASMTRQLTQDEVLLLGGQRNWDITPADPLGTTVRRISGTGGDRIVVRNRFTYDPDMEPGRKWIAQITRDHDASFNARFPMLDGVEMEYRWGGRLCLSLNSVQVIQELEAGMFSACCQNGLGTARGTLAGILAAELACGISSPALNRALNAAQPSRLPGRILSAIGANVKLRWGEFQAGREK